VGPATTVTPTPAPAAISTAVYFGWRRAPRSFARLAASVLAYRCANRSICLEALGSAFTRASISLSQSPPPVIMLTSCVAANERMQSTISELCQLSPAAHVVKFGGTPHVPVISSLLSSCHVQCTVLRATMPVVGPVDSMQDQVFCRRSCGGYAPERKSLLGLSPQRWWCYNDLLQAGIPNWESQLSSLQLTASWKFLRQAVRWPGLQRSIMKCPLDLPLD
jgi:hypothetical protein